MVMLSPVLDISSFSAFELGEEEASGVSGGESFVGKLVASGAVTMSCRFRA